MSFNQEVEIREPRHPLDNLWGGIKEILSPLKVVGNNEQMPFNQEIEIWEPHQPLYNLLGGGGDKIS